VVHSTFGLTKSVLRAKPAIYSYDERAVDCAGYWFTNGSHQFCLSGAPACIYFGIRLGQQATQPATLAFFFQQRLSKSFLLKQQRERDFIVCLIF